MKATPSTKRILLIEDEPDQAALVKTRLEVSGYEVILARDGLEGLESVRKEGPDLILSDVVMPGMSGFEVCRKIKENPKCGGIPVILVTASGMKDLEDRCKAVGAAAWLQRPYDSRELMEKIEQILGVQKEGRGG